MPDPGMKLRAFYRAAVICFLFTVAVLVVLDLVEVVIGAGRFESWADGLPFLVRIPLGLIGAFSAVGIISVWFGTVWDCWFASKMPHASKLRWTLLLILTNMLGALIYYFRVFERRVPATR